METKLLFSLITITSFSIAVAGGGYENNSDAQQKTIDRVRAKVNARRSQLSQERNVTDQLKALSCKELIARGKELMARNRQKMDELRKEFENTRKEVERMCCIDAWIQKNADNSACTIDE